MTRRNAPPAPLTPPEAISYIRFSSPQQAGGDSLRRQTADTEKWCERNGIPLNTSLSLRDLGRSAYHGRHRDEKAALGGFLEMVKGKGVQMRGWYLIVENLDRLSREEERTALRLWLDILDAGINIVQLHPETVFRHERSDMTDIIRAIIELSRGHSESRMKSVRAAALWQERRRLAAEEDRLMTHRIPAWIEVGGDGLQRLIPDRAAVVKRIYEMAAGGYGRTLIAKRLNEEGVPPFGACEEGEDGRRKARAGERFGCGRWRRGYVNDILTDRRAVGELQPKDRDGKPYGDPIPGYYLAAVSEEEYYAASAAGTARRLGLRARGRLGNGVACVFSGLLTDARSGLSYYVAQNATGKQRVLINKAGIEGDSVRWTFPVVAFERAVLSRLTEIDLAAELSPRAAPTEEEAVGNELRHVQEEIEAFRAALNATNAATVAQELAKREARAVELSARLRECKEEEARPLADTAAEVRLLTPKAVYGGRLKTLDAAEARDREDARVRLRAALRRIVLSVHLVIVHRSESRAPRVDPRGRVKLLTAQINFVSGAMRTVRVIYRPATKAGSKYCKSARWWADSLKFNDTTGKLDIRNHEDAEREVWSMEQPEWGPTALAFGEVIEEGEQ
jgi:DNA invertase Pin-like site-specific DNA recombinase